MPYQNTAAMTADLLAGRIQVVLDAVSAVMPNVTNARLDRCLALSGTPASIVDKIGQASGA